MQKHVSLYWILFALVFGAVIGQYFHVPGGSSQHFILELCDLIGNEIFLKMLRAVVIPVVGLSIFCAISDQKNIASIGTIGGKTVALYLGTMLLAAIVGVVFVEVIQPGSGIDFNAAVVSVEAAPTSSTPMTPVGIIQSLISQAIPSNIFQSIAQGNVLSVIFIAGALGVAAALAGSHASAVTLFAQQALVLFTTIVTWILKIAPLGIFAIMTSTVASHGLGQVVGTLSLYSATVIGGLFFHALILLPLILFLWKGIHPFKFLMSMKEPILVALGTASSTAALPVTIRTAEESGEIDQDIARFTIPIGATINMDGTALYEAVAVLFMAQVFGIDLSWTQYAVIVVVSSLAAFGAAGIPSAGLVTMVMVIDSVNQTLVGSVLIPTSAIGLILSVDRFLDMFRTAVNVWGDLVVARLLSRGKVP